jgi:fibronectin type 3 domain-containing protein
VNLVFLRPSIKQGRLAILIVAAIGLCGGTFGNLIGIASAAACQAPAADYGTVTTSVVTPAAAPYRIWTRIQVPDTTNNTYLLEIDGTNCYTVGGSSNVNSWTWVAASTNLSLTQGTHTIKLIGNKPGVKIDRLVFASDLTCTPVSADGSECNVPSDTTPPAAQLTAPAANSTVSGTVTVTATATDASGVTKVEFYVNSKLIGTDTNAPYSFSWDTTPLPNDKHSIAVAAYDTAGNVSPPLGYLVTVQNGDKQAPTAPTALSATAAAYNVVNLNWKAATDNIAVTGYSIVRDGLPIGQVSGATAYTDSTVIANTSYSYQVIAMDAAANKSSASTAATVKTPTISDSQAPSTPANLSATPQGIQQVNLNWLASTDNTGVAGYNIYRATGTSSANAQKINSQPLQATSYADTNLSANTTYAYYVKAIDGAGNISTASNTATAQTEAMPPPSQRGSTISGTITDKQTKKPLTSATNTKAVAYSNGHRFIISPTGNDGVYVFRGLHQHRYVLGYRSDGYRSKHYSIKVNVDSQITKNIALQKR